MPPPRTTVVSFCITRYWPARQAMRRRWRRPSPRCIVTASCWRGPFRAAGNPGIIMLRPLALAGLGVLLLSIPTRADAPRAGTWKLTVPLGPGEHATFLLALDDAGGRVLDRSPP